MCRRTRFFGHRLGPLAGFVLGSFGLIIGWQFAGLLRARMIGVTDHLLFYAALGVVTWSCLRAEGVRFGSIGLQSRKLVPAMLGGCVLLLGCNLAGIALAAGLDSAWGLAVLWAGRGPLHWIGWMLLQLAVIALIEEIAFRGYLQNKLLALGRHRLGSAMATTLAITISAALFALWHVPGWDLTQTWTTHLPLLGMLFGTGVVFGVIYMLSGNLYLVAVLHALGNTWPFAFDKAGWPVWALAAFWMLTAVLYVAAVGVCLRLQGAWAR